jgi:hypothetical protein
MMNEPTPSGFLCAIIRAGVHVRQDQRQPVPSRRDQAKRLLQH